MTTKITIPISRDIYHSFVGKAPLKIRPFLLNGFKEPVLIYLENSESCFRLRALAVIHLSCSQELAVMQIEEITTEDPEQPERLMNTAFEELTKGLVETLHTPPQ